MRGYGSALIAFFSILLISTVSANAALFTDTVNFSGTGTYFGEDYLELQGTGSEYSLNYSHLVTFSPPAAVITSAEVTLTHHNNSDTPGELWFLYGSTSYSLGELARSTGDGWITQIFTIPSTLYSAVQGGQWSLQLTLKEITPGTDKMWIDKSVLSGAYTSVPIPATVLLFGSSLAGLSFIRRRWFLS